MRSGRSVSSPPAASSVPRNAGVLCELSGALFAHLPRSDQRLRGDQYLRGLVAAEGRKSVRNIASHVGGPELAQSLHHFIASSTWDWEPLSTALRHYADNELRFAAWVVGSVPVPKGRTQRLHRAGADDTSGPQSSRGQQAIGVWGVAKDATVPVKWNLLRDGEQIAECVAAATLGVDQHPLGPRPVVLNLPGADLRPVFDRYMGVGAPLLAAVPAHLPLDQGPGHARRSLPAARLLRQNGMLRRPVEWTDPATGLVRTSLVAGVRVEWGGRPLLLLGQWDSGEGQAVHSWLTNLTATPLGVLLRLAKFPERVERDFASSASHVGTFDYEGRSSDGWHRHMTLAAAAHVAQVIAAARARVRPWSQCMASMERMDYSLQPGRVGRGVG
ncbi:transposase [Streptomyces sp. NPDC050804]|uniref:IS701 family transposase n=1 Tax=Streptomyces sp. NPDC050804 TaxID=3154745 RepID=UPI00343A6883